MGSIPALEPGLSFPADEGLPDFPRLFDSEWVWRSVCDEFGQTEEAPERLRATQFSYRPGARARVSYVAQLREELWLPEDQFAIEIVAGKPMRLFRYPDDPYLPGLSTAASALDAHELLPKYVPIHPQRLKVEAVRYRPGSRAVLLHKARGRGMRVNLFARVMRPKRVERLLAAGELAERSGFPLPRLVGYWPEGGVVWLAGVPGNTVRVLIGKGRAPDPDQILDGLAPLWEAPLPSDAHYQLNLSSAFARSHRLYSHLLREDGARRLLQRAEDALRPFVEGWRPTTLAHNDFYDDQMLVTPEGRIVLVDFEETGPGDPMMDVANMLAHLRWAAHFSNAPETRDAYRQSLHAAAIDRFRWDRRELALREGLSLFRICSNPIRKLHPDWSKTVETGLTLVNELLDAP